MSSILLILVRYSDSKSKESFFKNHSLTILKVGNSWAKLQIWLFSAGQIPKSKINIWATLVFNLFPYLVCRILPFLKKDLFIFGSLYVRFDFGKKLRASDYVSCPTSISSSWNEMWRRPDPNSKWNRSEERWYWYWENQTLNNEWRRLFPPRDVRIGLILLNWDSLFLVFALHGQVFTYGRR